MYLNYSVVLSDGILLRSLIVSEDEFQGLADALQEKTQQRLETARQAENEVFGLWERDLPIEFFIKTKNINSGNKCYDDYKEILMITTENVTSSRSSNKCPRTKVLIKGGQGVGKTSLTRKIVHAWSNVEYERFCLVLYVSLKLANPDHSIEQTIVHQNCLSDLTPAKLRSVLKTFGSRCLVIFDGLEEHDAANNEGLMKIMQNRSFKCCNFIFTVNTGLAEVYERYFRAVVEIQGVKRKAAKMNISRIFTSLKNKEQRTDEVLKLEFNLMGESLNIMTCPMLLKSVCFLTCQYEIDTSMEVTLGLVYYNLIQCLYTKYRTSKDKEFEKEEFTSFLIRLGKLGLQNLWLRKSITEQDIKEKFGDDFDLPCGLIRKHDPLDSQHIVFYHSTIQLFFGAYYIMNKLKNHTAKRQGKHANFYDIHLKAFYQTSPLIRNSPYFREFCNWISIYLLDCESSWKQFVRQASHPYNVM